MFVGLNPIISFTDGVTILSSEQNIFEESANTNVDKGFALLSIVSAGSPGSILSNQKVVSKTAGTIIDATLDGTSALHNAGAFEFLKK